MATEEDDLEIPECHVLAIASHVTSGYVGNTMATFCLQTLGCEVSAIHTVNYSNHVAYRHFTGTQTTPETLSSLYSGLRATHLDNFTLLLSGYSPTPALIREIGLIARNQRLKPLSNPGSPKFFWIADPVMGDNGRVYVDEACVEIYKEVVKEADLVLPNQFEAELLSGVEIKDWKSLGKAIKTIHQELGVKNVVVTSVRLPSSTTEEETLSVIGSTSTTTTSQPRLFRLTIPSLPIFFSGTGDMFAALLSAHLFHQSTLSKTVCNPSWSPPNSTPATQLPLALATEKVLRSMHVILKDTQRYYERVKREIEEDEEEGEGLLEEEEEAKREREKEKHLRLTRAAEVRVVRNARFLRKPPEVEGFTAEELRIEGLDGEE